jgi:hypothetical protein
MVLSEFTELEWLMLADAAEIMGMTGDPERAQHYLDLAAGCRRNSEHREPARETGEAPRAGRGP